MKPEFFYKLGHCQDLAVAEVQTLTKTQETQIFDSWLIASEIINVNKTGSLVFGGIILGKIKDFKMNNKSLEFDKFLQELLELENEIHQDKKVGISVPTNLSRNIINIAKKANYKKINVLKDKTPNIGNWKGLKNWYVVFLIGSDLILGKIDSYFDQEFYSKLDQKLPVSDMRRGQINLKLARSLVNLSNQKTVWDPFCGVGRITAASLSLKSKFYNSDIDEQAIIGTIANLEHAQYNWSKVLRRPVSTPKPFVLDAKKLSTCRIENTKQIAIVTEGYLGHNFSQKPTISQQKEQWLIVNNIWSQVVKETQKMDIPELVFCLPYYISGSHSYVPEFLDSLIKNTKYNYTIFPNKKTYIKYSRKDSIVGHLIVKLVVG